MAGTLKKLGELLVEEGAITPEEQELALEAQAIYGGRLGTNLVDLDFLTPEQVGTYLSLQLGVPQAHWNELLEVPPDALALLAKEHCQRYRVLPLGVQGHVLRLAMLDPLDNVAVQELGLLTKMRVAPHVAPEVVLLQALEKHHGIPRDKRFLRVTAEPSAAPPAEEEPYRRTPAISLLMPTVGKERTEEAAEFVDDSTTMEYVDSDITAPWIQPPVELVDLGDTLAALRRAPDRETAVLHLIDPLRSRATSCVLFVVRGAMAVAQTATRTQAARQELEQLIVRLDAPSLLEQAFTRRALVQGSGQADPTQREIARQLGWEEPEQACVAPICLADRVISLLCVQTDPGAFFASSFFTDLQRLCSEAAATYGRLVTSHKEPASAPAPDLGPPAAGPEEEEPPTLLDTRFFLTSRVGQSSIATVWRAIDTASQKVVAVHVLPTDALRTEELQRMSREVATLQKVTHPCLPRVFGAGLTQQDHPYVVMEWLGGTDLRTRLNADPLPPRAYTAAVLLQVSQGLDAAHQHGVLHRDVRPENVVLVGRDRRRVKLVNFGITREPSNCGDERYCGASEYRAPETERAPADAAADTYSVGVMAYEMLAGRRPAPEAIAPRRPLIDLANVPPLARELIMAALSGDPSARPLLTRLGQQLWEALNDPTGPATKAS